MADRNYDRGEHQDQPEPDGDSEENQDGQVFPEQVFHRSILSRFAPYLSAI
jgi:hypothetical protein